jgi:putative PEP-CTERM system histidine kinase
VLLAALVIYYSQALLYRSLDMNLMPVRSLCLILSVGMMAYSRARRGEAVRIRVSREMAYRSIVVLAVGFYLIGLGLFGAGMRYFNFAGNRAFFIALCLVFGLAVVVVLLSENARRRIRVLLHKHFYQRKYDYRQEWQQFTAKLSAAKTREDLESGILDFFTETFFLQGAALYLRDQDTDIYRCSTCLEKDQAAPTLAGSHPVIGKMGRRDWVVDLDEEAGEDPQEKLALLKQQGYSFLVPMRFERGLEGFVALGRRIYQEERLTYEDFDLMKILAHQAIGVLLSRKLYSQLIAANEMAAIGRVSTFVIHDLKNLVSGLGMVVDNARDYIDDPEFRADMFETLENTVGNMKGLIARLQNVKQKPLIDLAACDLYQVTRASVALSGGNGIVLSGTSVPVKADAGELQKVILNLLHNAREASVENTPVRVEVGRSDLAFVTVFDQGVGMTDEFIRTRLFRPFETTKKKGMGIGLYQCRQVVEEHGGRIDVNSVAGEGSSFTVWLPLSGETID